MAVNMTERGLQTPQALQQSLALLMLQTVIMTFQSSPSLDQHKQQKYTHLQFKVVYSIFKSKKKQVKMNNIALIQRI
jgi:hypothetical protein